MEIFTEKGAFTHGIIVDNKIYREFILEEEVMRHTFLVSNDYSLDIVRLAGDEKKKIEPDAGYYSACLMAARLKVSGLDKVTPEQVESLFKTDGQTLLITSANIEQRRELFRSQAEADAQGHPGTEKTGLPDGGSPGHEPGDDQKLCWLRRS
jgi:hypothetical protein